MVDTNAAKGLFLSGENVRSPEVGVVELKVVDVVRLDLEPMSVCNPFVGEF